MTETGLTGETKGFPGVLTDSRRFKYAHLNGQALTAWAGRPNFRSGPSALQS
jgi:hypothetical protein